VTVRVAAGACALEGSVRRRERRVCFAVYSRRDRSQRERGPEQWKKRTRARGATNSYQA